MWFQSGIYTVKKRSMLVQIQKLKTVPESLSVAWIEYDLRKELRETACDQKPGLRSKPGGKVFFRD